jgi:hypothetical protein
VSMGHKGSLGPKGPKGVRIAQTNVQNLNHALCLMQGSNSCCGGGPASQPNCLHGWAWCLEHVDGRDALGPTWNWASLAEYTHAKT